MTLFISFLVLHVALSDVCNKHCSGIASVSERPSSKTVSRLLHIVCIKLLHRISS